LALKPCRGRKTTLCTLHIPFPGLLSVPAVGLQQQVAATCGQQEKKEPACRCFNGGGDGRCCASRRLSPLGLGTTWLHTEATVCQTSVAPWGLSARIAGSQKGINELGELGGVGQGTKARGRWTRASKWQQRLRSLRESRGKAARGRRAHSGAYRARRSSKNSPKQNLNNTVRPGAGVHTDVPALSLHPKASPEQHL
jgi:hypothetical protein